MSGAALRAIQIDRERSIERIVNIGRLAGAAVCFVQFGLFDGQPPGIGEAGILIGVMFVALAAWSHRRLATLPALPQLRSLTLLTLVVDTTLMAALTLLLAHEGDPLNLLILIFAVLEGAMKRQFAGAVSVAVIVSGVQVVRLLLATQLRGDGFDTLQLTYFSGLVLIMAVFAGGSSRLMAQAQEDLAVSADRLAATHELLRAGLASFTEGVGLQNVLRQAVEGLDLDALVVVRTDEVVAWPPDTAVPDAAALGHAARQATGDNPALAAGPGQTMWTVVPLADGGAGTIVAARVGGEQGLEDLHAVAAEISALLLARRAVDLEESYREQARRLDRLRREFTTITHHEIRTPVTIIRAAVDALGPADDPDLTRRVLPALRRGTERLERLIDDLSVIQRLDGGGMGVRCRPVEVAAIVGGAVSGRSVDGRHIRTHLDPDTVALADHDLLRRVIDCLLDNAVVHGVGDVDVSAEARDGHVVIDVTDHGPGVPPDARQRIFERFTAADVQRHRRGAGLGLPLARDLARLMDGDVLLVDDDRTRFRVELRRGQPA